MTVNSVPAARLPNQEVSTMFLKKQNTGIACPKSGADRRFEEIAFILVARFVYLAGLDSWMRHCSEIKRTKKPKSHFIACENMNDTSSG